ncbi:glutamate decarboxylase [Ktedonobacter racemifer]|uniref:Glutamate decarboxylase n=1 Tax=Ktedonobacter racemifer DSM 44963 TaxID=485913 RepID=D6U7E9_KTERA|nr:glutamate decarboxylase [Ktedonobacter racemifer]EFH79810.1 glutamate decarboxylase [Ktedonobacter racemifer DSM 44963]
MLCTQKHGRSPVAQEPSLFPLYGRTSLNASLPRYEFPECVMLPQTAYNMIHDELMLDGNPQLNLASFVTTWMENEARQLMADTFDKNMIDKDEYPQTAEIESRCVNMLAHLWNAPREDGMTGCSTIGSSEACMLAGMAMKWLWRKPRQARGLPVDQPNLVMGINVHVSWEKFCRYWDVEPRLVPMEGERYHLSAEEAVKYCDENTIGVVAILGSTFDGSYEPVQEIAQALDQLQKSKGWDIPVHVDAAGGGFIAPFLQPDLKWDFCVPRVMSINASGHKYGLVYPGVGWIIWRDQSKLPEELIFSVNYLGGSMPTFTLNFSRPGSQVIAQYYMFLRLGREGYIHVQRSCQEIALYLSSEIAKLGPFTLITSGCDLPVVTFSLQEPSNFSVFDFSKRLREHGWIIPAYTFPKNREDLSVLRIVARDGLSHDMADLLIRDMRHTLDFFASQPDYRASAHGGGFNHGISTKAKKESHAQSSKQREEGQVAREHQGRRRRNN